MSSAMVPVVRSEVDVARRILALAMKAHEQLLAARRDARDPVVAEKYRAAAADAEEAIQRFDKRLWEAETRARATGAPLSLDAGTCLTCRSQLEHVEHIRRLLEGCPR